MPTRHCDFPNSNRLTYFYLGLKYHRTGSCCPVLSLINSLFWCTINHIDTIDRNVFVVTFKGDVIELLSDIGPLTCEESIGNRIRFYICSGVIQTVL
jgi:hypothetical protein